MDKYLHLDAEYRRRWQEFYLADGTVKDSRQINWRRVEWEKVVKIVTHIEGQHHAVDARESNFLFFLCFRWAGSTPRYKLGKCVGRDPIRIWTVGWSDGARAFLADLDFKTGTMLKKYISPLKDHFDHIHPRVISTWSQAARITQ